MELVLGSDELPDDVYSIDVKPADIPDVVLFLEVVIFVVCKVSVDVTIIVVVEFNVLVMEL